MRAVRAQHLEPPDRAATHAPSARRCSAPARGSARRVAGPCPSRPTTRPVTSARVTTSPEAEPRRRRRERERTGGGGRTRPGAPPAAAGELAPGAPPAAAGDLAPGAPPVAAASPRRTAGAAGRLVPRRRRHGDRPGGRRRSTPGERPPAASRGRPGGERGGTRDAGRARRARTLPRGRRRRPELGPATVANAPAVPAPPPATPAAPPAPPAAPPKAFVTYNALPLSRPPVDEPPRESTPAPQPEPRAPDPVTVVPAQTARYPPTGRARAVDGVTATRGGSPTPRGLVDGMGGRDRRYGPAARREPGRGAAPGRRR